jgi:hypothetical protein
VHLHGLLAERERLLGVIARMEERVSAGLGPEPDGDPAPPEEILEWARDELGQVNRWIEDAPSSAGV